MTDNEIINALECCIDCDCTDCPCNTREGCKDIDYEAMLDLINRQKAEIERLTVNMNAFGLGMKQEAERADTAKAEAIKEFVVKLLFEFRAGVFGYSHIRHIIKSIAKEMVGDNNG